MAEPRYQLIFEGRILPGANREEAETAFAQRFGLTDEQLPRFFSGDPVVLKSNLDGAAVQRLGQALTDVGVTFRIEPQSDETSAGNAGDKQPPAPVRLDNQPASSWHVGSVGEAEDPDLAPWESTPTVGGSALPTDTPVRRKEFDRSHRTFVEEIAIHQRGLIALVLFALAFLLVFIAAKYVAYRGLAHEPGVLIEDLPSLELINERDIFYRAHSLSPRAKVSLKARVLGTITYEDDRPAIICKTDLALGWGYMSDSQVLDKMTYFQTERYFVWQANRPPIPPKTITASFANMHIIPADERIAQRVQRIVAGQLIQLEGRLVDVAGPDGWLWPTSLKWDDKNTGSCEIIYVESISVLPAP